MSEQAPKRRSVVRLHQSGTNRKQSNVHPIYRQGFNKQDALLPPLNETSFSEQYKTFKALGGYANVLGGPDQRDIARDLEMRLKPSAQNRPFIKRTYQKPVFAEENFPMGPMSAHLDRSVFQANASFMLSPNNHGAETLPGSQILSNSAAAHNHSHMDGHPLFTSNMQQPVSVDYASYNQVGGQDLQATGDSSILSPMHMPMQAQPQYQGQM